MGTNLLVGFAVLGPILQDDNLCFTYADIN